ncbi:MAG: peptidase S1 [Acidobacteria bacterium]|nr:MAG: peptidase S1 [Acidobacteriota bacterium]
MYELPKDQINGSEKVILRKLRVWIVALGIACLFVGIGIGAMLTGRPAVAQNELKSSVARAPEALSASFAEIARQVEPAVVNIDTVTAAPELTDKDDEDKSDPSSNNPLLDMLRRQSRRPARGVGSGFIVDPKGYILTNQHVVEGATRIIVRLQDGEEYRGTVKGIDEETDVAVVKIDAQKDLPIVKLGNSDDAQVGDWVLAIGSPFGLDQTVTAGIISKKERQAAAFTSFQQFLQTDAAINRGNSGGPLVNMRGEVIGINSQIATSTGDYNGIGFALPSNAASFVYQQIISNGKVRRGYLGIFLDSVKPEFARVYGLPDTKGAIVTDVRDQQGPAGKAGMQANDVIVEYNGQAIQSAQDLINRVAATPVGETVPLVYLRDENGKLERHTTSVTIGERPSSLAPKDDDAPLTKPKDKAQPENNHVKLGVTLQEMTPQVAAERKLTGVRGLYVKDIDPNGIIAEHPRSLLEGDVILRINRMPVTSLEEFERIVSSLKPGDAVVLNVARYDPDTGRILQRIVQFTYQ